MITSKVNAATNIRYTATVLLFPPSPPVRNVGVQVVVLVGASRYG